MGQQQGSEQQQANQAQFCDSSSTPQQQQQGDASNMESYNPNDLNEIPAEDLDVSNSYI